MTHLPATVAGGGIIPAQYSQQQVQLIRDICAKDCTENEFLLLMQMAKTYQLDPFAKQIWAVKYPNAPAAIFCGRDGLLAIAHRSGQFDGMESGTKTDENKELVGWCRIYRKDMSHPFCVEVPFGEYIQRNKQGEVTKFWREKPKTMIQKVAEAQCLRRAFSISGLYSPEEIDTGDRAEPRYVGEVPAATPTCCEVCGVPVPEEIREKTKEHTPRVLCVTCFSSWWNERKEGSA
jgi:phage recombination protein Bet